jgi:cell division protein FtsQ
MKILQLLHHRAAQAAAGTLAFALLAAGVWLAYDAAASQPIRRVVFSGSTERIAASDLDHLAHAVQSAARAPSLAEVREAARRLAWVREVAVRRRTPDTLEIAFEAHEPVARWNDAGLVNRQGEVFAGEIEGALPRFRGADAPAAAAITERYAAIVRAAEPLASRITEVTLSARGAWQVRLESGLVIDLGRGDVAARIERLAAAWPQLQARGLAPAHADLRYPNGFALRGKGA